MKKILFILFAFALVVSCQKNGGEDAAGTSVVTYTVEAPVEFEIKSSASGEGEKVNALWYGVYHKKSEGHFEYMNDMSAYVQIGDATRKISVPIVLFKDQEYKIIFVAQHIETVASADGLSNNCYTYIINENGLMSFNPKAQVKHGEEMDAFVYWEETGVIKNDYKKEITLTRPVAQINISTSAAKKASKIDVKVSGTAKSYNVFEKTYSADKTQVSVKGLACSGSQLTTLYILPSGNYVDLDMTLHYPDSTTKTLAVPHVEVAPNFKTNVSGNI